LNWPVRSIVLIQIRHQRIAIVIRAAVEAVRSGSECITSRTIEAASFIRPSERRRVAV